MRTTRLFKWIYFKIHVKSRLILVFSRLCHFFFYRCNAKFNKKSCRAEWNRRPSSWLLRERNIFDYIIISGFVVCCVRLRNIFYGCHNVIRVYNPEQICAVQKFISSGGPKKKKKPRKGSGKKSIIDLFFLLARNSFRRVVTKVCNILIFFENITINIIRYATEWRRSCR